MPNLIRHKYQKLIMYGITISNQNIFIIRLLKYNLLKQMSAKMIRQLTAKEYQHYHHEDISKEVLVDFKNKILYIPAYIRCQIKNIEKVDMKSNKFSLLMKLSIVIDYSDLTKQRIKPSEPQEKKKKPQQENQDQISDDQGMLKRQQQYFLMIRQMQEEMQEQYAYEPEQIEQGQAQKYNQNQQSYNNPRQQEQQSLMMKKKITDMEKINERKKIQQRNKMKEIKEMEKQKENKEKPQKKVESFCEKQTDLQCAVTKYFKNKMEQIQTKKLKLRQFIIQTIKEEGLTIIKDQDQIIPLKPTDPGTIFIDNVENYQFVFQVTKTFEMSMDYDVYYSPFQLVLLFTSLQLCEFKPHDQSKWIIRFNISTCKINEEMIIPQGTIFLENYEIADKLLFITADNYSLELETVTKDWNYYYQYAQGYRNRTKKQSVSLKQSNKKIQVDQKPEDLRKQIKNMVNFIRKLEDLSKQITNQLDVNRLQNLKLELFSKLQTMQKFVQKGNEIKETINILNFDKEANKFLSEISQDSKIAENIKNIKNIAQEAALLAKKSIPNNLINLINRPKEKKKKKTIITDNFGFANIVVGAYKKPVDSFSIIFLPIWGIATANMGIFLTNNDINLRVAAVAGIALAYVAHMNVYRQLLPYDTSMLLFVQYLIYLLMFICLIALGQTVYIHFIYTQQQNKPQTHFQFTYWDPFFIVSAVILGCSIACIGILFILHYVKWEKKYKKCATLAIIWKNIWTLEFWIKVIGNPSAIWQILLKRNLDSIMNLIKQIDTKAALSSALEHVHNAEQFSQFDMYIWSNKDCDELFEKKMKRKQIQLLIRKQDQKKYAYDSRTTLNHFKKFHPELHYDYHNGVDLLEYSEKKQDKTKFKDWCQEMKRLLIKDQYFKIQNKDADDSIINQKEIITDYILLPKRINGVIFYEKKEGDEKVKRSNSNKYLQRQIKQEGARSINELQENIQVLNMQENQNLTNQTIDLNVIFDYNPYILHSFVYKTAQSQLTEQDLWQILYVLVKQANSFHQNDLGKLGNIKPENIFIVGQTFKVRCKYSWPQAEKYSHLKKQRRYLAPQQQQGILFQKSKSYRKFISKAQAFSIGLTMVDILLLKDYSRRFYNDEGIFNLQQYGVKYLKMKDRIGKKLQDCPKLKEIIVGMCLQRSQQRYSCLQLFKILGKYESLLINEHPFDYNQIELRQINQPLDNQRYRNINKNKLKQDSLIGLNEEKGNN